MRSPWHFVRRRLLLILPGAKTRCLTEFLPQFVAHRHNNPLFNRPLHSYIIALEKQLAPPIALTRITMAKKAAKKKAATKKAAPKKKAAPAKATKKKAAKKSTEKEGEEDEAPVKKKKKKAKRKTKKQALEDIRLRAYWGVFNHAMKRVALYEFNQRKAAEKRAKELSPEGKPPHFVMKVKEEIEAVEVEDPDAETEVPKKATKKKAAKKKNA